MIFRAVATFGVVLFTTLFLISLYLPLRGMPMRSGVVLSQSFDEWVSPQQQASVELRRALLTGEIPEVAQELAFRVLAYKPFDPDAWMNLAAQSYRAGNRPVAINATVMSIRLSFYESEMIEQRLVIISSLHQLLDQDDQRLAQEFVNWAISDHEELVANLLVRDRTALERYIRTRFALTERELLLRIFKLRDAKRAIADRRGESYDMWGRPKL